MNPIHPPPPAETSFLSAHHPNPPPPPPPPPSLTNVLSDLTYLLHLSATTLHALPPVIGTATSTVSDAFVPCPFNPNHRLPPSSLFSHYLNCPSSVSLPHNFQYPLTLQSCSSIITTPPSLPTTSSDLTVSMEKCIGYNTPANSFFYQNCPGPVTPSIQQPSLLNLPRVLYMECFDFNKETSSKVATDFSVDFIGFLPSEIWAIRSEIEAWGGGFPASYSLRILRAILRLRDCKLLHLYEWIIANSPRYGLIIDSAITNHMVLLVKLCLKVIVKEAFDLAGITSSDGELKKEENFLSGLSNPRNLVEVMMWLALQFSILYGEVNGKFFAVDVLKECILDSALHASLFCFEGGNSEFSDGKKVDQDVEEPVQSVESIGDNKRDERVDIKGETVGNSKIFVSQVAAAVAALHERSFIEEKIKALRNTRPPSAYQRNMEHAHVSKLADEERQKRPDYRPIIEHDGFLWQRSGNQEANKVRTKEELLAEERDYKRRRMSYRGKKLKRNTLEVTRDIIEEYMEEIRQAGGIGGTSNALASENLDKHASAADVSGSSRNSEIPEENRVRSVDYRKELHSHHYLGDSEDDNQQRRRDSSWGHGRQYSNRNVESIRYDRDDHSGSQDGRQISSHAREQMHGREKRDFVEASTEDYSRRSHKRQSESHGQMFYKRNRDEYEQKNHKSVRDDHDRSSRKRERDLENWKHGDRGGSKRDGASRERDEDKGAHADRGKSKTNRKSSSRTELHKFEDRYDPADSHEFHEDDF